MPAPATGALQFSNPPETAAASVVDPAAVAPDSLVPTVQIEKVTDDYWLKLPADVAGYLHSNLQLTSAAPGEAGRQVLWQAAYRFNDGAGFMELSMLNTEGGPILIARHLSSKDEKRYIYAKPQRSLPAVFNLELINKSFLKVNVS
jgi:hypothetical protein